MKTLDPKKTLTQSEYWHYKRIMAVMGVSAPQALTMVLNLRNAKKKKKAS